MKQGVMQSSRRRRRPPEAKDGKDRKAGDVPEGTGRPRRRQHARGAGERNRSRNRAMYRSSTADVVELVDTLS